MSEIKDITTVAQNEFDRVIKEAKRLNKKDKKDTVKISKKPILIQRVMQLYLSGHYTNSQIASIMCVSKSTIDNLLKKPEVLDQIVNYQNKEKEYVESRLKALRDKSLDTLFELLDSEEDTVRLNASKDILDRTGHATKKDQNVNINVSYEERLNSLTTQIDTTYIDTNYIINDEEENEAKGSNGENERLISPNEVI